jgi:plastocyanin
MRNRLHPAPALLLGGLLACFSDRPSTGPQPPGDGATEVAIRNFAYAPPALTVVTGTAVSWTNEDEAPHTVTADDGESFESTLLDQGGTYQLAAPAPGTYEYHCEVHPFMTGTLTVTAE